MSEFKIEKDVPLTPSRNRYIRYPLAQMAVNDSFFIPTDSSSHHNIRKRVTSAANHFHKKHGGEFATRTVNGGVRVWRTA